MPRTSSGSAPSQSSSKKKRIARPPSRKKSVHVSSATTKHLHAASHAKNVQGFVQKTIQNALAQLSASCTICKNIDIKLLAHNPYIAIAIAYLVWGMAAPITKLALTEIGPASLMLIRFTVASLVLFPFVLHYRHTFSIKEQVYIGFSGIFAIFLHILLIYLALPLVPSINSPIINAVSPFVLIIFARLLFRERVTQRKYIGMGFGLIGVVCIAVIPAFFRPQGEILGISTPLVTAFASLGFPLTTSNLALWVGNGLLVLGVLFGVMGTLFIKPIEHIPGRVIAFWQFALAACLALPFALTESNSLLNVNVGNYALIGILYNALLSSVVAYSLYNGAIHKVQAADSGLLSYLAPISALLLSAPLLHEYPNLWFIIGSVLVLVGVWVAEHKIRHHTHT